MKNCPNCKSEVPKEFDICWNCNYDLISKKVFIPEKEYHPKDKNINCLRCETPMKFQGTQKIQEGIRNKFLVNKVVLDMYECSNCGKVEFFT